MSVNQDTLKQIVEAAIMAAEAPLTVPQIIGLFPEEARPEREQIDEVIAVLEAESAERGVELRKIGGGYRYQTREQLAPWLRKLNEGRPPRYSRALLETLAIVAYRQPVTRGDIEDIRGVAVSTEIMRTLSEREWIKQVGVRDVPGHPALYGTTAAFLAYFNLQSLKELPALIEQRDLKAIAREQNIDLPFDEDADDAGAADYGDDPDGGEDDETVAARADLPDTPTGTQSDDGSGIDPDEEANDKEAEADEAYDDEAYDDEADDDEADDDEADDGEADDGEADDGEANDGEANDDEGTGERNPGAGA